MATGVTINPKLVKEIITTTLGDADIEGAINGALVMYRYYLSSYNIPTDLQLEIKRYLAAHLVSLLDPSTRVDEEKIGDASVKYSKVGDDVSTNDLMTTRWGQTASLFDPTGVLKKIGGVPPAWYSL
jgi:hypothetical protein